MRECKSRARAVVVAAIVLVAARAGADPPRLDLVWVDPASQAEGTYAAVAAESRGLLAALGADVAWTEAPRGAVVGPESLVVIAVPTSPRTQGQERHVMGSTRAARDSALAVWVFPDQVAWALGLELGQRRGWGEDAEAGFARALARVATHEILHALGASAHAKSGLMAARLDRTALTAPVLRIDATTVSAVRRTFDQGVRTASGTWTPALLRAAPPLKVPGLRAGRGR
jgi:hypothetical protein